jgi:hypothetical protein
MLNQWVTCIQRHGHEFRSCCYCARKGLQGELLNLESCNRNWVKVSREEVDVNGKLTLSQEGIRFGNNPDDPHISGHCHDLLGQSAREYIACTHPSLCGLTVWVTSLLSLVLHSVLPQQNISDLPCQSGVFWPLASLSGMNKDGLCRYAHLLKELTFCC